MAQGIELPIKIVDGRWKLLSGDKYIEQLVMAALLGDESENPFQRVGLGEWMIYDINDALTQGEIKSRIEDIFEILKKDQLARLDNINNDLQFYKRDSELYLTLQYINMETKERKELDVPIPSGAS